MCHCTEYKLSALQVRISEENKPNATTQQFETAKISGCARKQESKTHNLQLQNEAALMSCRIRVVEHRKSVAGLSDAHPGLQDWILLHYTRIENAYKVCKKTFDFLSCIKASKLSFPFSLLRHYQIPECFLVKKSWFWARATVLLCHRYW